MPGQEESLIAEHFFKVALVIERKKIFFIFVIAIH